MKKFTLLTLISLSALYAAAQDASVTTGEIYVNFKASAPVITWLSPATDTVVVTESSITVKVGVVSGSAITRHYIRHNDLPVGNSRSAISDAGDHNFDLMINTQVMLESGFNTIEVGIRNADNLEAVQTRVVELILDPTLIEVSRRRDFALLFATDEYDEWGDLQNPVFDAETIAEELSENYGFETELVLNKSKDEIFMKIREYSEKVFDEHDQLFIFFAGHGQYDEQFKKGYLVTRDSQVKDLSKSSYISHADLREWIDGIPNQHIFVAMDVCFSGSFDRRIGQYTDRGGDYDSEKVSSLEFIERKLRYKTRKYLTSGGIEYVSDGVPGHHSPFAAFFLDGLRNYGGADRILTLQELYTFLERLDPEPRIGDFGDWEPGSDFIFVSKDR